MQLAELLAELERLQTVLRNMASRRAFDVFRGLSGFRVIGL